MAAPRRFASNGESKPRIVRREPAGRIVLDKTELTKSYDFTLEWAPDDSFDPIAPSLFTAWKEQLGLRLEPRRIPVEVLVIDRIEKLSRN